MGQESCHVADALRNAFERTLYLGVFHSLGNLVCDRSFVGSEEAERA